MKKKVVNIFLIFFLVGILGFYIKKRFISKSAYARMFVTLGPCNIPSVEVEIQGKIYQFEINLDYTRFPLYLSKDILSQIDKKTNGISRVIIENEEIAFQTYLLPKIKIEDFFYTNVAVMEIDSDKDKLISTEKHTAEIGLKFFGNKNLLLDFSNSTMIVCDGLSRLNQVGYSVEDMTKTTYEVGSKGLILSVNTDMGLVKMGISTANTWSLIRSDLVKEKETYKDPQGLPFINTPNFIIGGKDFGSKDLHLYDIPESFGVDGCIGMDFLLDHIVFFDSTNKIAYIGSG